MPSVELETTRWTEVRPEGKTQKAKALGSACYYYRTLPTPPELASEGTEIAENAELTMDRAQAPYWFRTKKATAGEAQKSCILELKAAELENVGPTEIVAESIGEGQLKTSAVTVIKTKVKADAVPTGTESLTAVAGTAGVGRIISFGYSAKKEANAKVKLVHNLGTTAVVVAAYTTATKVASEVLAAGSTAAGAIEKVKVESANEILVTLAAAEPGSKEEFIYVVTG